MNSLKRVLSCQRCSLFDFIQKKPLIFNSASLHLPIRNGNLFTPRNKIRLTPRTDTFSYTLIRLCSSEKIARPPELDTKKKKEAGKGGPISWINLGFSGVVIGAMLAFYYYARNLKEEQLAKERKKALGKAKIGGTFELIDHNGNPAKSEDFLGRWVMLYFGFTHCPDICPEEMEKIAEVVDLVGSKTGDPETILPLFISVDPKRDGVKEVAEYVKEFHPRMVGLTGTEEMVRNACKAFRVYFSAGPQDEDEDYIVDHTIIVYLLDPDGKFVDYYGQTKDRDMITNSVMLHMAKFKSNKSKGLFSFGSSD